MYYGVGFLDVCEFHLESLLKQYFIDLWVASWELAFPPLWLEDLLGTLRSMGLDSDCLGNLLPVPV